MESTLQDNGPTRRAGIDVLEGWKDAFSAKQKNVETS